MSKEHAVVSARSKTLIGHPDADAVLRGTTLGGSGTFARVEPRDLIRGIVARVRPHADAKDVDVVVYCTSGPVWVVPQAFSDALFEVLDNAVRATRRGYPVFVHVRDTDDGDVLWQIQDEGDGMTERDLARLGHGPDTAAAEGPGLGVARAWALVEAHGGMLHFESAPRVGTTASIWLPACGPGDALTSSSALERGSTRS
jgi:signal transduction histidine kinase